MDNYSNDLFMWEIVCCCVILGWFVYVFGEGVGFDVNKDGSCGFVVEV